MNLSQLTPCESMVGEDDEETAALQRMLSRAVRYLKSFRWCPPIKAKYLGFGVGGVLALFLFKFKRLINGTDEWLWVVVGDLPSAYFVVDEAPNPATALSAYCDLMQKWVNAVVNNSSLDDVFPVDAPPTKEYADMLDSRITFIREKLVPIAHNN